ncbi:hypothetical protein [Cellulomonas iranensis]|uniref:Uncharacterized protein n=1 Tax=Cellulomonas iranensis TaxID=76862 RepID=A0ABU0GIN5_9CELL|nr:hypothetical protein [Cellulomonas iranensis]MDQ0425216.1 hypothetical protein [Cellulomonas iranensis]
MTHHAHPDGQHDPVQAAHEAWWAAGEADPHVLAAVHDGLRDVPVMIPTSSWFGLPHQRSSVEAGTTLRQRRRG